MAKEDLNNLYTAAQQDKEFLSRICQACTSDEIIEICSAKGISIESTEAEEFLVGITQGKNGETIENLELTEDDLEDVNGGYVLTTTTAIILGVALYGLYLGGKQIGKYGVRGLRALGIGG